MRKVTDISDATCLRNYVGLHVIVLLYYYYLQIDAPKAQDPSLDQLMQLPCCREDAMRLLVFSTVLLEIRNPSLDNADREVHHHHRSVMT